MPCVVYLMLYLPIVNSPKKQMIFFVLVYKTLDFRYGVLYFFYHDFKSYICATNLCALHG